MISFEVDLVALGALLFGGLWLVRGPLKRARRISKNLQRPILVVGTGDNTLEHQHRLLKEIDLFVVSERFHGAKACDSLDGQHRLLVLGYSDDPDFGLAFKKAASLGAPVLVFAQAKRISDSDMATIASYTYAAVCNFDMRLISDVFAIMSTFSEQR